MSDPAKRVAIYPGSFDPFTNGHLDLARRASRLFDEVIVAVARHAEKTHQFTLQERVEMAADACAGIENVRVEPFEGLVIEYARRTGARALVKGLRSLADFEREREMDMMNHHLAPELETCYLMTAPRYAFLSASLVKHVYQLGGDVSDFVTPRVLQVMKQRWGSSRPEPEGGTRGAAGA